MEMRVMEFSLFPSSDTQKRPSLGGTLPPSDEAGRAPALPEAPRLPPEPEWSDRPSGKLALPATSDAGTENQPKVVAAPDSCPRCRGKLVNPDGLGWCQNCGYCHSLEQDRAKVPLKTAPKVQRKADPNIIDFARLLVNVPSWFWTMLAGAALVVLFTWLMEPHYRRTPFVRCVWCTVQIAAGALLVFFAEFWALLQVASADEALSAKDLFLPGRLWTLTVMRLPKTRWQVWMAAWGVATIVAALVLIGGLPHWFKHLPKASTAQISEPGITRRA
jgi:hypothetical protein